MTVTIKFDDLEPGTVVTNQFESKGILFTSPCAVFRDPETLAHSLHSQHQSSITPLPTRVIRARFVEPKHSRLAVTASFSNAGMEGMHAVLRVFDANGHQIDERSFGSTGFTAKTEIDCPNADIAGFEISGRTNRWDALDSITFDHPATADFRVVYDGVTEPLVLRPDGVVKARLTFFRLHGSHGEILLSVTKPCPGTTWSFDPPMIHSGVPHTELEIRANPDAAQAYHFAVQVVALPRHRTAGRHERDIAVPLTISGRTPSTTDEDDETSDSAVESGMKNVKLSD
jgi:hypothetical protein